MFAVKALPRLDSLSTTFLCVALAKLYMTKGDNAYLLHPPAAIHQMKYFEPLLDWLKRQDPELTNLINFDRMAVMGHSRGGKLAALHYASEYQA